MSAAGRPDVHGLSSVGEFTERLGQLRAWAGVSYRDLVARIAADRAAKGRRERPTYNLVYRSLQPGRTRLDPDLAVEIVRAITRCESTAVTWRMALQEIASGRRSDPVDPPQDLPPAPEPFVGRDDLRRSLARILGPGGGGPRLVLLHGMGGVGKTSLALRAAHDRARVGPATDLRLYVDLRGFDPDRSPADPRTVLELLLRQLGVHPRVLVALDDLARVERYRRLTRERSCLLVLDNARDEAQVLPLLPDGPRSRVLVTSRHRLGGLEPTARIEVVPFTAHEAVQLLRHSRDDDAWTAEDACAARRIAQITEGLPLAVGLVSAQIVQRPSWTVADHCDRLEELRASQRVEAVVATTLRTSLCDLTEDERLLLSRLTLHPGPYVDAAAAGVLAEQPRDVAARTLEDLLARNLLMPGEAGRYRFHDLVRATMHEVTLEQEPPKQRRAARSRLERHYVDLAHELCRGDVATMDPAAHAELDAQHLAMLSLVESAGPGYAVLLSECLAEWLAESGHHQAAIGLHRAALTSSGPPVAEAEARTRLAMSLMAVGAYEEGESLLRSARHVLVEAATGPAPAAVVERALTELLFAAGDYDRAMLVATSAVSLAAQAGDPGLEARAEGVRSALLLRLGRVDEALEINRRSIRLAQLAASPRLVVRGRLRAGHAFLQLGRFEEALAVFDQIVAHQERVGQTLTVAQALCGRAHALLELNRPHLAERSGALALSISRRSGDPTLVSWAANLCGRCRVARGAPSEAEDFFDEALAVAAGTDARQEALALVGLADVARVRDEPVARRDLARRALQLDVHLDPTEVLWAQALAYEAEAVRC